MEGHAGVCGAVEAGFCRPHSRAGLLTAEDILPSSGQDIPGAALLPTQPTTSPSQVQIPQPLVPPHTSHHLLRCPAWKDEVSVLGT